MPRKPAGEGVAEGINLINDYTQTLSGPVLHKPTVNMNYLPIVAIVAM